MKNLIMILIALVSFNICKSQTTIESSNGSPSVDIEIPISFRDGSLNSVWSSTYSLISGDAEFGNYNIGNNLTAIAFKCEYPALLNLGNIKVYIKLTSSEPTSNDDICTIKREAKNNYCCSVNNIGDLNKYYLVYNGPYIGDDGQTWQKIVFDRAINVNGASYVTIVIEKENQDCLGSNPNFFIYTYNSFWNNSPYTFYYDGNYGNCQLSNNGVEKPQIQLTFDDVVNTRTFANINLINNPISPGGNTIYTVPNGTYTFYDEGGSGGNYVSNSERIITFVPCTTGSRIKLSFISFNTDVSDFGDFMCIYDGASVDAPMIGGRYEGGGLPSDLVATNINGAITVLFYSDGIATSSGWDITVLCEQISDCNTNLSTASISRGTDDYSNAPITITFNPQGNDQFVSWYQSINGDPFNVYSNSSSLVIPSPNTSISFQAHYQRAYCPNPFTVPVTYTTSNNYYLNSTNNNSCVYCESFGNNNKSGKSPKNPKATLSNLLANITLASGDTIFVDRGDYTDKIVLTNMTFDPNHPVVLMGAGRNYTHFSNLSGTNNTIFELSGTGVNNFEIRDIDFTSTSTTNSVLKIDNSNGFKLHKCNITSSSAENLFSYNSSIFLENNTLSSETTTNTLLTIENVELADNICTIQKNVFKAGAQSIILDGVFFSNSQYSTSSININRNFFGNSEVGIKIIHTAANQYSNIDIFNNSFYNSIANIFLKSSLQDNLFKTYYKINVNNNILASTGSGFCIKSESTDGLSPFLFNSTNRNIYYSYNNNSNLFRSKAADNTYLDFVYTHSSGYDVNAMNVNPLYSCPSSCNLSLTTKSSALGAGLSVPFVEGIGAETWGTGTTPIGAGQVSNTTTQFSKVGKEKNTGNACLYGVNLKFSYTQEYAVGVSQKLNYKVYDDKNNLILNSSAASAPVILVKYGENSYSLSLNGITLGNLNLLVIENDKNEKWYLHFYNKECGCL